MQLEAKFDNDKSKAVVAADLSQTTSELAAAFNVRDKTILINLKYLLTCSYKGLSQNYSELRLKALRHPPNLALTSIVFQIR